MQQKLQSENVLITGLMGAGKTTVGRLLSNRLDKQFIDTDQYIDEHFGPVSRLFAQPDGDEQFRLTEERVAVVLSKKQDQVIASGGRFMVNQNNIDVMKRCAHIICLTAELDDLVARLRSADSDTFRPRFDNAIDKLALMKKLEQQSRPYYSQFVQVHTTGKSPSVVAAEIQTKLVTNNN